VHEAEREYIYWIGQHLFKTSKNIKEDIDGYIASGSTEGNDLNNIHLVFSKLPIIPLFKLVIYST